MVDAFRIYLWLAPAAAFAVVAILLAFVARWLTRWRGATAWIPIALPILICALTAALHLPFLGALGHRVDRIAGHVREPVPSLRALAVSVAVTLALAAVFLAVTSGRRSPALARRSALAVAVVLCGVHAHVLWILLAFPVARAWTPAEWHRPDLLVPFRPCRGALLWAADGGFTRPLVRVDDVWLRFADPRLGGERVWAVSGDGQFNEGYFWLGHAEAVRLRVRRDDPAIVRCDSSARPEHVAPAAWHHLGYE